MFPYIEHSLSISQVWVSISPILFHNTLYVTLVIYIQMFCLLPLSLQTNGVNRTSLFKEPRNTDFYLSLSEFYK